MQGEYDYWRSRSKLPDGLSLMDYMHDALAVWAQFQYNLSVADLAFADFGFENLERAYWMSLSGLSGPAFSLADAEVTTFALPRNSTSNLLRVQVNAV